ncbi:tuberculostearic acid methyltransferase ufaa1 [Quercus suber]|uniref:Tuberculostearic acid methyltransferase ufaa1 n=1 Tax=Quercus suber TaxID=58331 RepID=A0AAW0LY00_QUESU
MAAANSLVGKKNALLSKPKHMEPSLIEAGARLFVTRFLGRYISAGCLTLLEEDGTVLTFEGDKTKCSLKVVLKVHNPQFYWKIMTRADLGLADAYIDGDISFADKNEGLLNLFLLLIASRDSKSSISKLDKRRGWWTPLIFTAAIGSASYCFKHLLRQNSLTQARRNISRHYELSNELFALYLDESMTYSTGLFKREDEDLKVAQLRKLSSLIEKARIDEKHEILEIGCGWGSFAIEVVNQTGCKYTGITLSKEQLKLAEQKVKDAGLQMIEHVGHEYMEEFFRCCDSLLAEDGLFVLQFISIPDQRYDQHRRSADFMKEYIFPGGCLPSLNSVISAMANASRFCVEHVENIGIHYYQTLRYWRKNFAGNRRKVLALGFDEKFMRTWEYYFDYCASGFKSRTLGDYQVVFSRLATLLHSTNHIEVSIKSD